MLRKSIKINSGGPKAKKDYVVNIDVFLLPKKRRKLLLLPSSPSLVQGVTSVPVPIPQTVSSGTLGSI